MSFRPIPFAIAVWSLTLLNACGGGTDTSVEGDEMANVPFTREVSIDTCMVMISQSVNYCDWRAANKGMEHQRSDHMIALREVYHGMLDSNLVMSLSEVSDLEMAQDFVRSDVHMAPLKQVSSDETIKTIFLGQQLEYTAETMDTLVFYMSFKTLNYERWEKAFLDDYRENPAHEFEVTRVFRGIDEPNHVHMIFQVNDPNYVQKMEKNNAFRMKMLAAGVVSYPVTYKFLPAKA